MSQLITLNLVTPEKNLFELQVKEVTIPAYNGQMQALPLHTPYFTELSIGILEFTDEAGNSKKVAVTGGFAEVLPNKVTVLVRTAELPEDIDAERAMNAKLRAEQRLNSPDDHTDMDRASAALQRAMTRLHLIGKN